MNLDCPELIADFEKRAKAKTSKRSNDATLTTSNESSTPSSNSNKRTARESGDQEQQEAADHAKRSKRANDFGYGRGLEIEKILGATDVYGELMFL